MHILIVYGTNSGGTRTAAELVHDVLADAGYRVSLKSAEATEPNDFQSADLVILGSCTWERFEGSQRLEGQLQEHMFGLTRRLASVPLAGRKFAVFGLGDSSYTHFCGSVDRLTEFLDSVHGEMIVPPLRIDGFYFKPEENELRLTKWAKSIKLHD